MSTLLDKTRLPLWVWIVIIVIGSLVVLATIGFTLRYWTVRRRQAAFVDTFGDENLPQRRVTVRRGRVVESSKYLSLTGSKFGLNAFGPDDDSRAGARSKSPFEWWSTMKDRSQHRNSQITQMTTTNDTSSIYGMPSSPNAHRVYQGHDSSHTNTSLYSIHKDDEIAVSVTEEPASPSPTMKNFSRSFSRQGNHPNISPRQPTLSRIEESSPHTSMIAERRSRGASYASYKPDTRTNTPSLGPESRAISTPSPLPPRGEQQHPNRSKPGSIHHEARQDSPSAALQVPMRPACNDSRSTLGDDEPRQSRASSRYSLVPPIETSRRQSQITALPEAPTQEQTSDYWGSRSDLRTVQSASKKGRVLRKKSSQRAEMVTQADS
ncbi:hypothetical protein OHC33_004035 [Knufia fluminis]|uniref:Uncharacterized protein n=1 Tax=Knufia fluminis TaxID=191047 RepID=A0AAN8I5D8_9EURO|nr:hypothetical protein OHC33_004035 [Knufia fluminis]